MKKWIKASLIASVIIGGLGYSYVNKSSLNLNYALAEYQVSANDLYNEYLSDEASADVKYLGKVVEVKGSVINLERSEEDVRLMLLQDEMGSGILCELEVSEGSQINIENGMNISIRGICTGKLIDIVFTNCVII